jgi:hypothetical protein
LEPSNIPKEVVELGGASLDCRLELI